MAASTAIALSVFLDYTPGVLSIIGLNNILLGLIVAGIAGEFSIILLVPIVVSAACALGNGLGYYIYADYPALNRAVASPFADLAWLIQEAGLNFYSYAILTHIIHGGERVIFMTLFWALMLILAFFRVAIIVFRIRFILDNDSLALELTLGYLHVGYFTAIALAECASAVFLLKTFRAALRSSTFLPRGGSLFRYLMRSTEIRLSTLALIGIMRAVVFPCQFFFGEGGLAGQLDHFASIVESLFPMVMFIDILGSRLVFAHESSTRSNNLGGAASVDHAARKLYHSATQKAADEHHNDIDMFATPHVERSIEMSGGSKPSGAIMETEVAASDGDDVMDGRRGASSASGGIRRTTEFEVHEGRVPVWRRYSWQQKL